MTTSPGFVRADLLREADRPDALPDGASLAGRCERRRVADLARSTRASSPSSQSLHTGMEIVAYEVITA